MPPMPYPPGRPLSELARDVRRSESTEGNALGDKPGGGCEYVSPLERGARYESGPDTLGKESIGSLESQVLCEGEEQTIVRPDQSAPLFAANGQGNASPSNARIDHRDVDRPAGKAAGHVLQKERGLSDSMSRQLVTQIDNRSGSNEMREDRFHLGGVRPSDIGRQGDEGSTSGRRVRRAARHGREGTQGRTTTS